MARISMAALSRSTSHGPRKIVPVATSAAAAVAVVGDATRRFAPDSQPLAREDETLPRQSGWQNNMYPKKHAGPRELFRIEESQRVDESPTLAAKYPQLKSLTADLHFSDSERSTVNSRIKYTITLDVSKSVFRFSCPNNECIRGDYDLSEELADAIAERRTQVSGEKPC